MGRTITEKIFAAHAGKNETRAGEMVFACVDLILGTDITTALSAEVFDTMGVGKVFDPSKIALVNDHFVPAKDIKAAELSKAMREFAKKHGVENYFEVGRSGICHVILPEKGLVVPGDLVVGADSHTCTYGALGAFATGIGSTDMATAWALGETWFKVPESIKIVYRGKIPEWVDGKDIILHTIADLGVEGAVYKALEFGGESLKKLSMADRFTICNMAIEAGAKAGLMEVDETTEKYLKGRARRKYTAQGSDPDARYSEVREYDLSSLEPTVALPYLPGNVKRVSEIEETRIDQVVIGSCTNGRIEDLRIAGKLLASRKVHPDVRLLIIPGSQEVFLDMLKEGLAAVFTEAGGMICPPSCGPCIGGHLGVLGAEEVGLYTTNRNFVGRNGHPTSKVYLCGPAVAAASAVKGVITHPGKV
ncbi:MAG: 3-isopropylmalate dehydratase large subunit [Candidatus Eiseniibacteriota bacterium]|nr:MAG: 3-isopropylmalate dehydratase large subunit [Candidatus Eisenbacteria bacterium]